MKIILFFCFVTLFGYAQTLHSLIDYAKKHSTISKQNQSSLDLAALNRQNAKAQQFGELNIVGDYNHYNIEHTLAPLVPSSISSGTPVTTSKDIYSAGLSYTLPLFTGFAQTRNVEMESIATQMSHAKVKLSTQQLIYNIRTLYLSILAQEEIYKAQRQYRYALGRLRKKVAYEVKLGKKAKVDYLKASADESMARTKEALLRANIEVTKATLSALVGKEVGTIQKEKIHLSKPHYNLKRLYEKAQGLSKVAVDEMAVKKAEKAVQKSYAMKLPQVNFNGYVGKNYGEDIQTHDWDNETLWQVGVNVRYNLVDFGQRNIAVEKAKVAKMQAGYRLEQTKLDLKKLLRQGVANANQTYASYRGNQTQYRLSLEAQKIEQVRYENDLSTMNDLLLARAKTWLAKAQLIESKYNYQKSQYYIEYLMEEGVTK
jgi:outer membrane protein TolC